MKSQRTPGTARRRKETISQDDPQRGSAALWRIFCAIEIPSEVQQRIANHIKKLRLTVPEAKASWSKEHIIHLTLKFLGGIPPARVENVSHAAARAVAAIKSFPIVVAGVGAFPNNRRARTLWIGIEEESGELGKLYDRLEVECFREGFAKDERRFHPHLTIARLRNHDKTSELLAAHQALNFPPTKMTVNELVVFRSQLSSDGSIYTAASKHQLEETEAQRD